MLLKTTTPYTANNESVLTLPLSLNYFFKNENKSLESVHYGAFNLTTSREVKALSCVFAPTLTALLCQHDPEE